MRPRGIAAAMAGILVTGVCLLHFALILASRPEEPAQAREQTSAAALEDSKFEFTASRAGTTDATAGTGPAAETSPSRGPAAASDRWDSPVPPESRHPASDADPSDLELDRGWMARHGFPDDPSLGWVTYECLLWPWSDSSKSCIVWENRARAAMASRRSATGVQAACQLGGRRRRALNDRIDNRGQVSG